MISGAVFKSFWKFPSLTSLWRSSRFFLGYNREQHLSPEASGRIEGRWGTLRYLLKWWLFFTSKKITAHLSTLYSRDNAWKENGGLLFRSDMPNVMMYCCMIKSLIQISLQSCVHWRASQEFMQNRKRYSRFRSFGFIYFLLSCIFHQYFFLKKLIFYSERMH